MGRPKDRFLWSQVDGSAVEWKCRHCDVKFRGSATRIRNHLSGAGNDISACTGVPSHIRDEALRENTRKRRRSSSVSPMHISSSSIAAAPLPRHDPKKAPEEYARDAFMKMLMTIGVSSVLSDAINHPTVREFLNLALQNGVPLSLLGGDRCVIEKSLFNIEDEMSRYMLMVKESWKKTGCTLITFNLSEKKENFPSGGKGMYVIGFYCPKGFIFVKAPPFFHSHYVDAMDEAKLNAEIFKDALKQHGLSLEVDDITRLIKHRLVVDDLTCSIKHHLIEFTTEPYLTLCETSDYVCNDICQVYEEMGSMDLYNCLRLQIQAKCMEACWKSKWANRLISQAARLHELLLEKRDERDKLHVWYCRILAKKGEKMRMAVGTEKQHHEGRLSVFLLIMRLAADVHHRLRCQLQLHEKDPLIVASEVIEIKKIVENSKFWVDGRKLALVLTLLLRISDIMDTLVPSSGYLNMTLHKVERALLEVNKTNCYGITKADKAFCFWTRTRHLLDPWCALNPPYFLQLENDLANVWLAGLGARLSKLVEKTEKSQLKTELLLYHDVFSLLSKDIQLNNYHPVNLWEQYGGELPLLRKWAIKLLSQPVTCMCNQVKKHIHRLQGVDDCILRLNVGMMEEFKMLGDNIYKPIDVNLLTGEWIPAGLLTSKPNIRFPQQYSGDCSGLSPRIDDPNDADRLGSPNDLDGTFYTDVDTDSGLSSFKTEDDNDENDIDEDDTDEEEV